MAGSLLSVANGMGLGIGTAADLNALTTLQTNIRNFLDGVSSLYLALLWVHDPMISIFSLCEDSLESVCLSRIEFFQAGVLSIFSHQRQYQVVRKRV